MSEQVSNQQINDEGHLTIGGVDAWHWQNNTRRRWPFMMCQKFVTRFVGLNPCLKITALITL